MMLWRTVGGLLLLAILGLAAFETLSPTITNTQARDAANAVAGAASSKIFEEACPPVSGAASTASTTTTVSSASTKRLCGTTSSFAKISQDARAAAEQRARLDHVRIITFSIDQPNPVVRVTISKQARSIILIHTPWRHYDDVNASATATPS
jgi:hypothetical protein